MEFKKLILPVSIIIASVVFGGFYYAGQVVPIARQRQIKLEQLEQKKQELEKRKKQEPLALKLLDEYIDCRDEAVNNYFWDRDEECKKKVLAQDELRTLPNWKRNHLMYGGCDLPLGIEERLKEILKSQHDECHKEYDIAAKSLPDDLKLSVEAIEALKGIK